MKLQLRATLSTKGSRSLKELAQGLSAQVGYKVFRTTKLFPKRRQLLYGQGVDKITQYKYFKENNINALEYTTNTSEAENWISAGATVFGRKYLNSSCGKGIVIFEPDGDIGIDTICPVYTKYKPKKREFRVHIYRDKVVAIVEKKKRKGFEGTRETKIRNLENGYVFCQNPTNLPEGIEQLALAAAKVSPSFFRGVDIGFNEKKNDLFVIEVNSAPGIQGSNVQAYIQSILSQE